MPLYIPPLIVGKSEHSDCIEKDKDRTPLWMRRRPKLRFQKPTQDQQRRQSVAFGKCAQCLRCVQAISLERTNQASERTREHPSRHLLLTGTMVKLMKVPSGLC
mmetsp:Transcript_15296/g.42301  ORF Transcript_15296/g.42301 Transcript_15296/m.42301 type:complete len:104 (+) Transcript_15296:169-480(+)